jgi:hypothetical protein
LLPLLAIRRSLALMVSLRVELKQLLFCNSHASSLAAAVWILQLLLSNYEEIYRIQLS